MELRRAALCSLLFPLSVFLALPRAEAAPAGPVLVFAAASLKNALDEAAVAYKAETGEAVVASYAATSALARQIEAGAQADIVIAADTEWMDYLNDRGLIDAASRANLASNALVLIAPAGSSIRIADLPDADLADRLGGGRLAVAETGAVPAGRYARAALGALGYWPKVATRLAEADNVRAALMLVARGEAPLGIVYRSDAIDEPSVKVVATFPEESHPPILYPAARVAASRHGGAAAFLAYLRSAAGAQAFARHGFAPPD